MFLNRFFENLGRLFFSKMRPFFFFLLAALPIFCAILFLYFENDQLNLIEERFMTASRKGKGAFERKKNKERFIERYSESDPYFIDQQIESLQFLQKERERLQSLTQHPALPHKEALTERLALLTDGQNRLEFIEENIRATDKLKETDEKQRHPVQMDGEDIQKLLSLLEDLPIGSHLPPSNSPQILVKDFKLKRLQGEVFEVELELLKREFIK